MPISTITYPFTPKSTRFLTRGQFWAIPLRDGQYGAGCVVGHDTTRGKPSSRMFIAGVVQWCGLQIPRAHDLEGKSIVRFAFAHLKVITETGGAILGEANLSFEGVPRAADDLSLSTWGYGVPTRIAEGLLKNGA